MQTYTCHVTRSDNIPRRIEVLASDRREAINKALGGKPGSVSVRTSMQADIVLDALGVRMSPFPLLVAA